MRNDNNIAKWAFIGTRYRRGWSIAKIAKHITSTQNTVRWYLKKFNLRRAGRCMSRQMELL